MNGRAIPGAYLFRLYVCDKEMSWPHHIEETHQPDWVVYVRDSEKFRLTDILVDARANIKQQTWTVGRIAPQGSQRTPATRIAATTPELTIGILNSVF